jgi:UDP-N-acetylmuramyl pentapeptide phosphotransferase/UDP-N-acetylglucosamine-1-phosphate transferase
MLKEKNIVVCIILSFVTCGLYGIYWLCEVTRDVDTISHNPQPRSGGMVILLTIVTCGLYSFYWWYKNGELMEQANEQTRIGSASSAVLYLILSLIGLGIVNYILLQLDINKYAKAGMVMAPQQPVAPQPPQPPYGPTM